MHVLEKNISWSRDPWQLRKMCQTMKNTLYHAEPQLFEKTNIGQNVR